MFNEYLTKEAREYNGVKTVSSINSSGRTGLVLGGKNETRPPFYTIHQSKLKMDKRLKYKSQYHKSLSGKHRQ